MVGLLVAVEFIPNGCPTRTAARRRSADLGHYPWSRIMLFGLDACPNIFEPLAQIRDALISHAGEVF
jgi:hypothetical protein